LTVSKDARRIYPPGALATRRESVADSTEDVRPCPRTSTKPSSHVRPACAPLHRSASSTATRASVPAPVHCRRQGQSVTLKVVAVETTSATTVEALERLRPGLQDRKSTRLNSSHVSISYAVFCL